MQNDKFGIIANYYSEHYDEIKAFIAKNTLYALETEDMVQNVFVRLLSSNKMITPLTMPSLVYTVARNLIFDYWRHRKTVEEYEHYVVSRTGEATDALSVYSAVEINELLEKGIARLSGSQREIYRLNISEGLQVSEISERLSLPYKSVEHRLGSARKEIRNYMRRMLA